MSDAMPVDTARALAGIVHEMPTGHVEALARSVASLPGPDRARWPAVLGAVPQAAYRQHAERLLQAWEAAPDLSGAAVALALLAAVAARDGERRDQVVEVVATGPASLHVSLRQTRAVVLDLFSRATREVLVVSFAAYRVPEVVAAIDEAVSRGVAVRFVLETVDDSGGALTHDAAQAFRALGARAEFYTWPAERRPTGVPAALHAKALVADDCVAFISSANLTGSGLDHNLELGVVVTGGPVPAQIAEHFKSLMAAGVLRRV
jgi:phosphatidylserine/phosphatidylglycerophosphate/cardiolipin synthase-like enzyme